MGEAFQPSRREFLRSLAAGTATSVLLSGCARGEPTSPNVLLIVADDLGIDALRAYGGGPFETPHIDQLAQEGTRFENCYATPLCIPSRVELLTGLYPFRTQWVDGWEGLTARPEGAPRFLDPEIGTFAQILRDAGYSTALAGKWQLCQFPERPDHVRECGFDEYSCWTWTLDNRRSVARRYLAPSIFENGTLREGLEDRYGPDVFCQFLIDFITRHRLERFFALYSMVLPHRPFFPPPGTSPRGPQGEDVSNFAPMVRYMDALVGRIVRAVGELGLDQRTLILFTSDNGTPSRIEVERHGRSAHGAKGTLSEAGTRVPLLARWTGTTPAGSLTEDLIDLSDLYPTFAELAGAHLATPRDGKSFAPRLRGTSGHAREWVFSQLADLAFVREKRWKLYRDGRLYDLNQDPFEEHPLELASAPGEARRLEKLLDARR